MTRPTDAPSEITEAAVTDASPAGGDLPELRGWEACDSMSRQELESYLQESCMEGEATGSDLASIEYRDEPPPPDGEGRINPAYTAFGPDAESGMDPGPRMVVYRHDGITGDGPEADLLELKTSIGHEVGHTVWRNASPEAQAQYTREVYEWKNTEQPELTPDPTDYARTDPEEHFCEVYGKAMADPRYMDKLDSYRPQDHSFQRGMASIRDSAAQVES